ncbi:MAG: hypothetical protein V1750_06450, partial [Acidobacteriota bacterium]
MSLAPSALARPARRWCLPRLRAPLTAVLPTGVLAVLAWTGFPARLLAQGSAATGLGWDEVKVASVVLDAPGVASVAEMRRVFGVVEGETLSRVEIRAGVQALLATGEVEDVVVEVESGSSGASVHVRVQAASRVRRLVVEGLSRKLAARVKVALGATLGTPLKVALFETGLERAIQRLRDDGYPEATLDPELQFDVAGGTVAMQVTGRLGAPLVAGELGAPGTLLRPHEVARRTGISRGDVLAVSSLERGRRRLIESLRREGYWEAEGESASVEGAAGGAAVRFAVRLGPRWQLEL